MLNKKTMNRIEIWFIIIGLIGILGGILIGMMLQQMIITASLVEIATGLEGTTFNIEVDVNETQLVREFNETIMPELIKLKEEEK